jgi:hypothetical protein
LGGEDNEPLNGAARAAAVEGGLGGCLDPVATGPYGGSREEQEEKCHTRFLRPKPDAHRMYAQDQVVIHTVRM